jgi:hypothetical protein
MHASDISRRGGLRLLSMQGEQELMLPWRESGHTEIHVVIVERGVTLEAETSDPLLHFIGPEQKMIHEAEASHMFRRT